MDERQFDTLARSLAAGVNRRQVLQTLIGTSAALAGAALTREAEAARRGFSGPCRPSCNGLTCGANGCGGTCACPGGGNCICLTSSGIPNAGTVCAVNEHLHADAGCRSSQSCQDQYGEPYFCDTSSGACYLSCLP